MFAGGVVITGGTRRASPVGLNGTLLLKGCMAPIDACIYAVAEVYPPAVIAGIEVPCAECYAVDDWDVVA